MKIFLGIFLKNKILTEILFIPIKFPKWKNLPSKKLLGQSVF
jgi:hypothetical protein